jgi:hypothetical protein
MDRSMTEPALQPDNIFHSPLTKPAHSRQQSVRVSLELPGQELPPHEGMGLAHVRSRVRVEQVRSNGPHAVWARSVKQAAERWATLIQKQPDAKHTPPHRTSSSQPLTQPPLTALNAVRLREFVDAPGHRLPKHRESRPTG